MDDSLTTYFEIRTFGDSLKIEVLEYITYNSDLDWDNNWLRTEISVGCGDFSGTYIAELMTLEFKELRNQFDYLYHNLTASTLFKDRENQLSFEIKGNGNGKFELEGIAYGSSSEYCAKLYFTLDFDQSYIPGFIKMLDTILQQYPVIGNFRA